VSKIENHYQEFSPGNCQNKHKFKRLLVGETNNFENEDYARKMAATPI
jgi:hypothetical protein